MTPHRHTWYWPLQLVEEAEKLGEATEEVRDVWGLRTGDYITLIAHGKHVLNRQLEMYVTAIKPGQLPGLTKVLLSKV